MSYTWYLVIASVGAVILLMPKEFELFCQYTELQVARLRLFLLMYPSYFVLKWRMRYMLWRIRYNQNNRKTTA